MIVFVLCIISLLVILLIFSKYPPALLFAFALGLFVYFDLISVENALGGFVNEAVVVVLLLMLISIVIEKTNTMTVLSKKLFKKDSESMSMLRLVSLATLVSGFLNNTAVVASFLGVVKNNKIYSPSKFLIPLVYAASLGGMLTLIGTSTNLILNGLIIGQGLPSLRMFDFALVGVPVCVAGILYLVLFAYKLLPAPDGLSSSDKRQLEYFVEAKVIQGSQLIGKNISENKLRNMDNLFLANIIRENKLISSVSSHEIIEKDDILVFTGDITKLYEFDKFDGLSLIEEKDKVLIENLREVIVSHNANIVGKTIKESNFRSKFDAAVVAVKRHNENIVGKFGAIKLQPGDNLILEAGKDFDKRDNLANNFYLVNKIHTDKSFYGFQSIIIVACFLLAIVSSALELISFIKALLLCLTLFIILNYLRISDMKRDFPFSLLLLIGCSLGISNVMMSSGAANFIAEITIGTLGSYGLYGCLTGIYILTLVITQFMTNNAAVALAFPIAYSSSVMLHVNPLPFFMAIAFAASASFITPFAYQTNLMVYSTGQYKFSDYMKLGVPLAIIYSIIALALIPVFFKF